MELAITPLLGRTTRRVTLDDVDFTQCRVFLLAIGQFTGQAHAIEHTFAAGHFTRLACGFTCTCSFHNLAANDLGIIGALLQIVAQGFGHDVFHRCTHFARHQFVFGLAAELRFRHLHRQHATQAFTHVVTTDFDFGFFGKLVFFNVFVDHTRHRCSQTRQVRATIALWNVVGETQHTLVVTIVPLHRHFYANAGARNATVALRRTLAFGMEGIGVQYFFASVDELHKALHTTSTRIVIRLATALVNQTNAHTIVQITEFTQTLAQNFIMKIMVLREDFNIGQKVYFGATLLGIARHTHGRHFKTIHGLEQTVLHKTFGKLQRIHLAVTAHRQAQPF